MELTHRVNIPKWTRLYDHKTKFSLWGSCFSSELTRHLSDNLFDVIPSPFGIMYNPASIAKGLRRVIDGTPFEEGDLFVQNETWYSNMHHGDYASEDKELALARINGELSRLHRAFRDINVWVFTFGTSYVYEESRAPHEVVNNCHRRPAKDFHRRRLSIDEIVEQWEPLLHHLLDMGGEVIFTVSPICHYRDGAHESRLSKAVLLLAIDELQRRFPSVKYFPSYEIMTDELRDYRFYGEDLSHPSPIAVKYIMERFTEACINPKTTKGPLVHWEKLRKRMSHRPMTKAPDKLRQHYSGIILELEDFNSQLHHPSVQEAIKHFQSLMDQL
ncbi:GSCFA domain-containing protein [Porphyromonas sp.]|uniref:GSCFA domain-containing protein n=1 Tax=Porphyromonas sp. TaxID=1924944 RepID=UPI0026DBBC78|nr:GSCFA domain-containing protein [Porphyromonas sp.]MDO4770861.1 GSCFA domain-containing protein [Porphyromonas sp.]